MEIMFFQEKMLIHIFFTTTKNNKMIQNYSTKKSAAGVSP